jgi:hypothetical protein
VGSRDTHAQLAAGVTAALTLLSRRTLGLDPSSGCDTVGSAHAISPWLGPIAPSCTSRGLLEVDGQQTVGAECGIISESCSSVSPNEPEGRWF